MLVTLLIEAVQSNRVLSVTLRCLAWASQTLKLKEKETILTTELLSFQYIRDDIAYRFCNILVAVVETTAGKG